MSLAVAGIFLVLAVVVALGAIKIVPQGREYTVEQFGRYTRTLKPGISLTTTADGSPATEIAIVSSSPF